MQAHISEIDPAAIAWLAGLIEGEGCIEHALKDGRACLTVAMTDEDVVRKCAEITGCGKLRGPLTHSRHPDRKPFWRWTVAKCDDVVDLLIRIRPWMGTRRQERIAEVLAAWAVNPLPKRLRTHCLRGHPFTAENTYLASSGGRGCYKCAALKTAAYRAKYPERARASAIATRERRKRRLGG